MKEKEHRSYRIHVIDLRITVENSGDWIIYYFNSIAYMFSCLMV